MIRRASLALVLALLAGAPQGAQADDACGDDARLLSLDFDSGAAWQLCAGVNAIHGLALNDISYRAPGDINRSVLRALQPASVLLHTHDRSEITTVLPLNARRAIAPSCAQRIEMVPLGASDRTQASLCLSLHDTGLLVRYGDIRGVRGGEWRLTLFEEREGRRWRTRVVLGETGRLSPSMAVFDDAPVDTDDARFGIRLADDRLHAESSMLTTWRMEFDLDTPQPDHVEEFDFLLRSGPGARRVMRVTELQVESLRTVDHARFRGWRVRDDSGAGYYLDSQNSDNGWSGNGGNWTRFSLAVSRADGAGAPAGTLDLDRIVDGELLENAHPVLWYSDSALLSPRHEDASRPIAASSFNLLPFDWTVVSPFAPQIAQ